MGKALAREYLVNFYGEMTDGINAGEESDRCVVCAEQRIVQEG